MTALQSRDFSVANGALDAQAFAWSPDGSRIAVLAPLMRIISVFDVASGTLIAALDGFDSGGWSVGWTANGAVIGPARGDPAAAATIWDPVSGRLQAIPGIGNPDPDRASNMFASFSTGVQGDILAGIAQVPGEHGPLSRVAAVHLPEMRPLGVGRTPALQVIVAPSGTRALVIEPGGTIAIVDLRDGRDLVRAAVSTTEVSCAAWLPQETHVIVGCAATGYGWSEQLGGYGALEEAAPLKLIDLRSGESPVAVAEDNGGNYLSVDVSRDGQWLATTAVDGTVRLRDPMTMVERGDLSERLEPTSALARFAPDGRRLGVLHTGPARVHIVDLAG